MAAAMLSSVQACMAEVSSADEDTKAAKREALTESMHQLLLHIAQTDVDEDSRRQLDAELVKHAAVLKGSLLKALRRCDLHRALLGLPALKEETRKHLAAAPAKGVSSYLEEALCKDIDACRDPRALISVQEVHQFMTGAGRLKKELNGVDLPPNTKKACRTVVNRATKAFAELERQQRQLAAQEQPAGKPKVYEMEKDVRVEDREEAERQYQARAMGMDEMFDKAMQIKNQKAMQAFGSKSASK